MSGLINPGRTNRCLKKRMDIFKSAVVCLVVNPVVLGSGDVRFMDVISSVVAVFALAILMMLSMFRGGGNTIGKSFAVFLIRYEDFPV